MKTRYRALFACIAAASLVAAPGLTATAQAQTLAPISTGLDVSSTADMLQNPITAPIALSIILPIMSWHYFVWCPIGQSSGFIAPYSGECTF